MSRCRGSGELEVAMSFSLTVPLEVARDSRRRDWAVERRWPEVAPLRARIAADLMVPNPERVAGDDSLTEAAGRMRALLTAFLPVCAGDGELLGIISFRDVHLALRERNPTRTTAGSLAAMPPVTIGPRDPVDHVLELMAQRHMWVLPVLDGRRLVGMIHYANATAADPMRSRVPH